MRGQHRGAEFFDDTATAAEHDHRRESRVSRRQKQCPDETGGSDRLPRHPRRRDPSLELCGRLDASRPVALRRTWKGRIIESAGIGSAAPGSRAIDQNSPIGATPS